VVAFGRLIFGVVRGSITLVGAIFVVSGALYTRFRAGGGSKLLEPEIMHHVSSPPNMPTIGKADWLTKMTIVDCTLNRLVGPERCR
jgi:hypothetical protein